MTFGLKVKDQAQSLAQQGKDPNQIANILCSQDHQGYNYGIGIVLGGDGKPLKTSSVLLAQVEKELKNSQVGTYINSAKKMDALKKAVLAWQRIPEKEWDHFQLALPSDAGTGAVQTAIQVALGVSPNYSTLAIEELGWPAYKTLAKVERLKIQEIPIGSVAGAQSLPIYQAGPMNTTGSVPQKDQLNRRAESAAKNKQLIILDRAYSGFEFAKDLGSNSYDAVMKNSYQSQLAPFIDKKNSFLLALSPTKAFVTFSLRPCGLLLAYCPDSSWEKKILGLFGAAIRARGSSFEHVVTRAFVDALINNRPGLESEHEAALSRVAEAEQAWREGVKGTSMEHLFSDTYAGLFRNANVSKEGAQAIYSEHLYPVISSGLCRINVTGIPANKDLAKKHIAVFSQYCS